MEMKNSLPILSASVLIGDHSGSRSGVEIDIGLGTKQTRKNNNPSSRGRNIPGGRLHDCRILMVQEPKLLEELIKIASAYFKLRIPYKQNIQSSPVHIIYLNIPGSGGR